MGIGDKISKAIKEGKWLRISYINKNRDNTFYWIAIKDVDYKTKNLKVVIFNEKKSMDTFESRILFDNIKSAEVMDFTSYEVPQGLLDKIENNLSKFSWLNYDHFSHNVLNYFNECNIFDNDPCQKDYSAIPGIDLKLLIRNRKIKLNDEQTKRIINDIYHYDLRKSNSTYYTLAMNYFSIDEGKNKFVICYYELKFDPIQKSLVLDKKLRFNPSFLIEGRRHSLFNYINMDMDEFTKTFTENFEEYQTIISYNLRAGERIDTMPDIMLLQRNIPVDLTETYNAIEEKYYGNNLPVPLKSFFGIISKKNNSSRRKEPTLIIYDKRININQMRVLYNAIKYPVTYVQGPPGTGKTQTIINVALSAFYNDKTMLICSSNNKPVDGIVEKLKFEYRGETVNFPYLRLGNFDDVRKATIRIRELFNSNMDKNPKEELLNKIKVSEDDKNQKLIELLNIQEQRIVIKDYIEKSEKLKKSFENKNSGIIKIIKEKVNGLKNNLENLPEVTNEEVVSLFEPLVGNYQLSQFLYFKSLQYIYKLQKQKTKYSELKEICFIEDDETRVMEFNKWLKDDNNMKKITDVFPVIFSTNISTKRLGTPNFMFDLVIMDESGQCNAATALIPIAKAESLLLVGDPNQLKPVIVLEDSMNDLLKEKYNVCEKYDYKKNSILDIMVANDSISKYILLKYHYRCGKRIINFSNQRYYNNSLNLNYLFEDGSLEVLDVKNQNVKQKNEAYEEALAIVNYIERNGVTNAYIITPFVNQKELILSLLKEKGISDIGCGTIHSMQGAEKDTIIISPAISPKTSKKTFEWIKNNHELINVAVTRAKSKLVIAADTEVINTISDKKDDLYNLIEYAKNNGKLSVPPNESVKAEIGKSNGSNAEDEFFKTVSHFCSCQKTYEAERNVKASKIFKNDPYLEDMQFEFDLVLYKKTIFSKKPVIIFEVNGGEHLGSVRREHSDRYKMKICSDRGIKLIIIQNSFVKAYEYIADIIMSSQNRSKSIQQTLFD